METMRSEKGKLLLVCGNYKFRYRRGLKNDIQRWECTKKTCRCFLKINSSNVIVDSFQENNNEEIETKVLNRQKLANTLKRKAIDDVSSKPSKLVHDELKQGDIETLSSRAVSYTHLDVYKRQHFIYKYDNDDDDDDD